MSVTTHSGVSVKSALSIAGARLLLKPLVVLYPFHRWTIAPLAAIEGIAELIDWRPHDVSVEAMTLAGVKVERLVPSSGEFHADRAICYFHGGAFLAGGPGTHRAVAASLARRLGVTVFNVDYRQLPDVGVGTSVGDGYAVYRAVVDSGKYSQVAVGGDSAGGYVSAKVVEFAHLDGVRAPVAYFGFSPLLAPTVSDGDPRYEINDAYLTVGRLRDLRGFFDQGPEPLRGSDDATAIDPEAFPPAIIVASSDEMLRVDAERMYAHLNEAGRPAELHVFDGGVHAFPVLAGLTPESGQALDLTVEFLGAEFGAHAQERAA